MLYGGADDDTLLGGAGGDTLYGGDGNDKLFGDRGYADPDVSQPDGNDFLYGQAGDDRIFGEGGNDWLEGDDVGQSGQDLLVGDGGTDTLFGRGGADQLLGGADNDVLYGEAGDDILNGNGGLDFLWGGIGDDTLQLDFASADGSIDVMHGDDGTDQVAVAGTVNQDTLDSNIDDFIQIRQFEAPETDKFEAISLNTTIGQVPQRFQFVMDSSEAGDIEQLAIQGLGGNDRLEVVPGTVFRKNLVLDGGEGNDTLVGGDGRDILKGGPGDDKLFGGENDDVLYGDEGRDELYGEGDNDTVYAGPGGDTVSGGAGREIIRGGPDNDYLVAGTGIYGSIITGGGGDDIIIGSSGRDSLDGEAGNDIILGGDLGDVITGGDDNDTLVGELGRDDIKGNDGNDIIYTHLNNDIRVQLGLPQIAELTDSEINSRELQLRVDEPVLYAKKLALESIYNQYPSPENLEQLQAAADAWSINLATQIDLEEYQSVYIDTADGGDQNDTIYGSRYIDLLTGGPGDDNLYSSGFSVGGRHLGDIIKGEIGNDTLWFRGTDASDIIAIRSGVQDTNRYATIDLNNDGTPDEYLREITIERIGVLGLGGNDTITIDFGNWDSVSVIIDAGSGDDVVSAAGANSPVTLIGGAGNDKLTGGNRDDVLEGDEGNDELDGGGGNDVIRGGNGNDRLRGGNDNDVLYGGDGDDNLNGGAGTDKLVGDDGVDQIDGEADPDELWGDSQYDAIVSEYEDSVYDQVNRRIKPSVLVAEGSWTLNYASRPDGFGDGASIAVARDGRFVVAWAVHGPTGSTNIYAQWYGPGGNPEGEAIPVDSLATSVYVFDVALNSSGGFVVIWGSYNYGGGFFGSLVDSEGEVIAASFSLSHAPSDVQFLDNGRFVSHMLGLASYSTRFAAPIGNEIPLDGYRVGLNTVVPHRNGAFSIVSSQAYYQWSAILIQSFNNQGVPDGPAGTVSYRRDIVFMQHSRGQRLGNRRVCDRVDLWNPDDCKFSVSYHLLLLHSGVY